MEKILIYFPYSLGDLQSGSSVRPYKIMLAFEEYGVSNNVEVLVVSGGSKSRKKQLEELKLNINPLDILFCYMENSTLPLWLTDKDHLPRTPLLEIKMFRYLKKNRIPTGLFYRDIYWQFDDEYPLKGYKKILMRLIYKLEHLIFKNNITHFFLPSLAMNQYAEFPESKTSELPPGGENFLTDYNTDSTKVLQIIYVGGISEKYGLNDMLEAVNSVCMSEAKVKLHLICRKEEFKDNKIVFDKYLSAEWLEIHHLYGEELKRVYAKADVAIIPRRKSIYNDFAVPVKLFEYASHGLPIIATNCNAQADIIKENEFGIVVNEGVEGLMKGINIFLDEEKLFYYSAKCKEALLKKHLWIHRVEEVSEILKKK